MIEPKLDPLAPSYLLLHAVVVASLTACSSLNVDNTPAYQRAQRAQALEVPPDLVSPTGTGGGIPEVAAAEASAQDISEFKKFEQLEQLDELGRFQQWKSESTESEQLNFQAFLEARKIAREGDNKGAGVSVDTNIDNSRNIKITASVDTSWQFLNSALDAMNLEVVERDQDKYRFVVILPELQKKSMFKPKADQFSLYLIRDRQNTLVSLYNSRREIVSSPEATVFMGRLASQVRISKVRLELEQNITETTTLKGSLEPARDGHLELVIDEPPANLWRQIDYIVDQVGFTVIERNETAGSFVIRYSTDADLEPEPKGIAKLAFWKKKKVVSEDGDLYTVKISETTDGRSAVRVSDSKGQMNEVSDGILGLLRKQL